MSVSKISDLLEKINATLKKSEVSKMPQIEYDILMQHLRGLYEELHQLRNEPVQTVQQDYSGNDSAENEIQELQRLHIKKTFYTNDHLLIHDVQPSKNEAVIQEASTKATTETVTQPVEKPERISKLSSINDNIKLTGSLNEKLKSGSGNEVHNKLSSKPLKDLIDLNNRFVLLNELFKGNAEAFSAAVVHIDTLDNYASAESFIQSQLVTNYYWEQSSQTVKLFMKLVKQKFGIV